MSGPITWEALVFVVGLMVPTIGTVGWIFIYFVKRLRAIETNAEQRVQGVEKDLAAYKLDVADKYASVSHLTEVEQRLVKSMDNLADRLDKLFDLIESIGKDRRPMG